MTTELVAATLLVAVPLAFNLAFFELGRAFDYPGILREPVDEILRRFSAGGTGLVVRWYALFLCALAMVPAAIATFWEMVLRFNVLLFLFNLIPMPPLDGFAALEGTFDLGQLGDMLRRSFPLPLLVVILILRWDQSPFYAWVEAIQLALLGLFGLRA